MKIIETFRKLTGYYINQLEKPEPSCFNGDVNVERYRVTIEKIVESKDIYKERLQKLWEECDNHHHWTPLQGKAKKLGVELTGSAGSKRITN